MHASNSLGCWDELFPGMKGDPGHLTQPNLRVFTDATRNIQKFKIFLWNYSLL
jgi:hypothetical protein